MTSGYFMHWDRYRKIDAGCLTQFDNNEKKDQNDYKKNINFH